MDYNHEFEGFLWTTLVYNPEGSKSSENVSRKICLQLGFEGISS